MKLPILLASVGLLAGAGSQPFAFEDVTGKAGIHFVGENGASAEKMMIETMGAGVGVIDYDGDGRLDILFVNGGGRPGSPEAGHNRLALYRNQGQGRFEEKTAEAGLNGGFDTYGMGVAVGDFDNDGKADLLLTGYPRSVLFHNNGNGTFTDVTAQAGVENAGRWATSAGWIDYDRDGLLDLAIANYVSDFSWDAPRLCGEAAPGRRTYCHPDVYQGAGVRLFHNLGHGRFADVTAGSGLETTQGKCLGLVLADLNGDGWPDLFVANDSVQNFLYLNQRDGTFREQGLQAGVGFSEDGQAEAGMGTDAAFLEPDHPAIYVTHLDNELNRLYIERERGRFRDATLSAHLGAERSLMSGFGVKFADFNNSGRLQILVANGHILDNISSFHPRVSFAEPWQLFADTGTGTISEVSGLGAKPMVARGLAIGDFDDDGLVDFVMSQNFGPPLLARNRAATGFHWTTLQLEGTGKSNRDAVGAEVTIRAGGRKQRAQVMGGTSYCSASDRRIHFGLGASRRIEEVIIRWPSGTMQTLHDVPVDQVRKIVEPVAH